MENQETYQKAKERVEAKIGFYIHLAIYVVVNIFLVILNLTTSPHDFWFIWPLIGWGIGIFFHGLGVFVFAEGSLVKERMIEKEIQKETTKKH